MKKKELKNQIKILEEEVARLRAENEQLVKTLNNQNSNILVIREKCPDTSGNISYPNIPDYEIIYDDPPFISETPVSIFKRSRS